LAKVEAVSPPPDDGYPGANTAEGQEALLKSSQLFGCIFFALYGCLLGIGKGDLSPPIE
jgi:hypothetical protein